MDAALAVSGGGALLTFTGRLTAAHAGACCAALREAQAAAPALELAFAGVEEADLSFLQLVCAAHRSAVAAGSALGIRGPVPERIVALVERAGAGRCPGGPPGCALRELLRCGGARP